jgi:hypothetical protein
MALPSKTFTDLYNQKKTDFFINSNGELQVDKDPTAMVIATSMAIGESDLYKTINYAIMQATMPFISTTEAFILNMGIVDTFNKIRRKQAEFAKGKIIITAIPQSTTITIPVNTELSGSNSLSYKTTIQRDCVEQKFIISSLIRQDNYAYATINSHELANDLEIIISGANESIFNGTQAIELINANTIRYYNEGSNQVATGIISGSFFGAIVEIQSVDATINANLTNTDVIIIGSNIEGINKTYIPYSGILDGSDIEDIIVYRDRINEFLTTPQNPGNLFQYKTYIKDNTNANFCYIFTEEDAKNIYINFVLSIYDANIDFSNYSNEALTEIKNNFIANNQAALEFEFVNCIFNNPSFVNINVAISSLSPNTNDMQVQIKKELKRYINLLPIKKYLTFGLDELSIDQIKKVILDTRDSTGRNPTFSNVSIDGVVNLINNTNKPILGNLTF